MIDALIAGHITGTPEQRTGKADSLFVVAKMRASAGDSETYMVNVIAFEGQVCDQLLSLRDGDAVALQGSLTPKIWTDKQGNSRPSIDLVAYKALTTEP